MKILSWFDFINNLPSGWFRKKNNEFPVEMMITTFVITIWILGHAEMVILMIVKSKKVPLRRIIHFIGSKNQGTDFTSVMAGHDFVPNMTFILQNIW